MKMELTLGNLPGLDFGKVDAAFKKLLERAVADCIDRPGDATTRAVLVKFDVVPVVDQGGQCERAALQVHLSCRVPAYRSRVFDCLPQQGSNRLLFDDETPEDVRQDSFAELQRREAERKARE